MVFVHLFLLFFFSFFSPFFLLVFLSFFPFFFSPLFFPFLSLFLPLFLGTRAVQPCVGQKGLLHPRPSLSVCHFFPSGGGRGVVPFFPHFIKKNSPGAPTAGRFLFVGDLIFRRIKLTCLFPFQTNNQPFPGGFSGFASSFHLGFGVSLVRKLLPMGSSSVPITTPSLPLLYCYQPGQCRRHRNNTTTVVVIVGVLLLLEAALQIWQSPDSNGRDNLP